MREFVIIVYVLIGMGAASQAADEAVASGLILDHTGPYIPFVWMAWPVYLGEAILVASHGR